MWSSPTAFVSLHVTRDAHGNFVSIDADHSLTELGMRPQSMRSISFKEHPTVLKGRSPVRKASVRPPWMNPVRSRGIQTADDHRLDEDEQQPEIVEAVQPRWEDTTQSIRPNTTCMFSDLKGSRKPSDIVLMSPRKGREKKGQIAESNWTPYSSPQSKRENPRPYLMSPDSTMPSSDISQDIHRAPTSSARWTSQEGNSPASSSIRQNESLREKSSLLHNTQRLDQMLGIFDAKAKMDDIVSSRTSSYQSPQEASALAQVHADTRSPSMCDVPVSSAHSPSPFSEFPVNMHETADAEICNGNLNKTPEREEETENGKEEEERNEETGEIEKEDGKKEEVEKVWVVGESKDEDVIITQPLEVFKKTDSSPAKSVSTTPPDTSTAVFEVVRNEMEFCHAAITAQQRQFTELLRESSHHQEELVEVLKSLVKKRSAPTPLRSVSENDFTPPPFVESLPPTPPRFEYEEFTLPHSAASIVDRNSTRSAAVQWSPPPSSHAAPSNPHNKEDDGNHDTSNGSDGEEHAPSTASVGFPSNHIAEEGKEYETFLPAWCKRTLPTRDASLTRNLAHYLAARANHSSRRAGGEVSAPVSPECAQQQSPFDVTPTAFALMQATPSSHGSPMQQDQRDEVYAEPVERHENSKSVVSFYELRSAYYRARGQQSV